MPAVVSPNAGTRTEPVDSYTFMRGTTATFKTTFTSDGVPVVMDTATVPIAKILEPTFISSGSPIPTVLASLNGSLVPGQQFEYQFTWDIPATQVPLDQYIISYQGTFGGNQNNFGDEFFTITAISGMLGMKYATYATVDDVRAHKFNIDSYLPESAKTVVDRNTIIEKHLRVATQRLREEMSLFQARGTTENNRLFCVFYTIWSILLSARGEDGSSVSSENLNEWRSEWGRILAEVKRKGSVGQGVPLARG
jgi:hypothetical protein